MIELKKVSKIYEGKLAVRALDGIDLTVGAGETVAVMGPSGSGKSTLLNLLGGLDVPSTGTILVDGTDIASLSEKERALFRRNRVSYIFQAYHLMPTLTAAQNAALPLNIAGIGGTETQRRVSLVMEKVGLRGREHHLPDELSGGERQRVAIARALVTGAPILLADEPTGNLDSKRGGEILDLLTSINRDFGTTLIMVTHDRSAASAAKRLIELMDGRVVGDRRQ